MKPTDKNRFALPPTARHWIAAALAGAALPVAAAEPPVLQEVVVYARKQAESLQDVPISVSAFTGETLEEQGLVSVTNLSNVVPGLRISQGSNAANIYMRGVGLTRGGGARTETGVGVYIDNVFVGRGEGQLMDLVDIESVEVLRGPQGTLFGKNTVGGAMLINTVKPDSELGGHLDVTLGNLNRRDGKLVLNLPLVEDVLLSRFAVNSVRRDGYAENVVDGKKWGDRDRLGAVAQLRWLASDDVTVDVMADWSKTRQMNFPNDCTVVYRGASFIANRLIQPSTGTATYDQLCNEANALDDNSFASDVTEGYDLDTWSVAGTVTWDIGAAQFKSITALREQEVKQNVRENDGTRFNTSLSRFMTPDERSQLSQEFQLSGDLMDDRLHYTGGLFALRDKGDGGIEESYSGDRGIMGRQISSSTFLPVLRYSREQLDTENTSYAAYTQWTFEVNDILHLTAGLRYSYEEREYDWSGADVDPAVVAGLPGASSIGGGRYTVPRASFLNAASLLPNPLPLLPLVNNSGSETWESVTPMASATVFLPDSMIDGTFIDSAMFYLTYSEGFKAGGFSIFEESQAELEAFGLDSTFDPEEVKSYELGMKMDGFDRRLRMNLSVFNMDYSDMQLTVARPDPRVVAGSINSVINAGEATMRGAELELKFLPVEGLELGLSASYIDAEFDEFEDLNTTTLQPVDRSDEDLPQTPQKTLFASIQYQWQTGIGIVMPRLEASYRSETYTGFDYLNWDIPESRALSTSDAVTTYNFRLSLIPDDRFRLTLWGENLTDEEVLESTVGAVGSFGTVARVLPQPRTYGVDMVYNF